MKEENKDIEPIQISEMVQLKLDNLVLRLQKDFEQKEKEKAEQRLAIAEDSKLFESIQTIITIIGQALIVTIAFIAAKIAEVEKYTAEISVKYCTIIAIALILAIFFEILFYKIKRRKFK